jgi:hypothetical protein
MFNNMKKIILSAASLAVAAVASVSVAPTTSEAVPAFARQTGAACLNCHFGAIPRLAQMGREFRMNGFRDTAGELLEDDHLSIPVAFNASFLMKARIQQNLDDADLTQLQWPDEAALLFGGRFGEHAGGLQEWNVIDGYMLGGKFAYVNDLDAGILAFAIGTSDALGSPSIFNDPSNAISRNTRGIQSRSMSLGEQPSIHDAATGLGVYGYLNDSVYFALGAVDAAGGFEAGSERIDTGKLGSYARIAFISEIAGFDTIIGAFNAKTGSNTATVEQAVTGVDFQAQGEVNGHQLGIYMPVVVSADNDITGFQIYANYNVTHGAGVQLGYDSKDDTAVVTSRVIVGGWYDLAQNIAINYEFKSTDDDSAGSSAVAESTLELEYVY